MGLGHTKRPVVWTR